MYTQYTHHPQSISMSGNCHHNTVDRRFARAVISLTSGACSVTRVMLIRAVDLLANATRWKLHTHSSL